MVSVAVSKRPPRSASRAPVRRGHLDLVAENGVRRSHDGMLPAELVDIQRSRIVRAACHVAAERGASNVTIADVAKRAGVSRRTFYELFEDRDECFLAALEHALSCASIRVVGAYEAQSGGWRRRVRAALIALLGFLDEEPVIGRVLIVESGMAGGQARLLRRETIERLTRALEDGARQAKGAPAAPAPLTGEGVVGGVLAVIGSRLTEQDVLPLIELANPLMSMIVLPYLGAAAARAELTRAVPEASVKAGPAQLLTNPFRDTGLRLTYRTVRVLIAIADFAAREVPASNRLIAEAAEMKDQGQVSKLLTRLRRAGLVLNTGVVPSRGGANNWVLTDRGRQVVSAIDTHTQDTAREGSKR